MVEIVTSIPITPLSVEDLYNYLYWDHRIYDIRPEKDYNAGHLCHAHNLHPSTIDSSFDVITRIDQQINDDYGRAEHPNRVIIYTGTHHDESTQIILNQLISYLNSSANPSNKVLRDIHLLNDGYESFQDKFPFLCSDSPYYAECNEMVWPSLIMPELFLGSSICRHGTIIERLGITHVLSLSDYPETNLTRINVKTSHWQISDSLSSTILPILPHAVAWISNAIDDEYGRVLIHCEQGVSRSASIVIGYLLSRHHDRFSTVQAAIDYVKSKRQVIRPNESFLRQLEEYARNVVKHQCTNG